MADYTPFKMKGSPMKRNFGIGASPMKQKDAQKMGDEPKKMMTKTVKTKQLGEELRQTHGRLEGAKLHKAATTFDDAFARARKEGKTEFTWDGKKYHTRTKEEEADKSKTYKDTDLKSEKGALRPSPNKKLREGERKTKKTTRGSKIVEKIGGKRYVTKYRKDDTIRKTKGEGYRTKHSKTGKLIQEKEGGKVLKELAPGRKVNRWHG